MGIEAIGSALGSVGKVASVAPAIGRGASIGPSIGRIGVGIEGGFMGIQKIANPFLGVPSLLGSRVEAIRNPFKVNIDVPKSQLRAADVIAEAERIVALAKKPSVPEAAKRPAIVDRKVTGWTGSLVRAPEPAVVRLPNPTRGVDTRVISNPFPAPKVETNLQSLAQKRAESTVANRVARVTSTPTQKVVQTEQIVEEKKVVTERKQDDKPQAKRSEEQSVAKIKIVEAVKVTQLRRLAISEAARKVKEEAEKRGEKVVITGKILKRFLSGEFWKYISPLVGRAGYDGTIPLTLNAIENNPTEYTNLEEAQKGLSQPVAEHIPLQKGEGGRVATVGEVREVLEGKEKEAIKSQTPAAEIVIKRVVRQNEVVASTEQTVNTVVEEKEEVRGEPTLKDLGLEELFPKAV